jgi:Acetyltransferase (GNAT) domain
MTHSLLAPADPRWIAFLESTPHDFYHLPAFLVLTARTTERATPVAVLVEEGTRAMLVPLLLRDVPGTPTLRDATSPYGYPGPLFRGCGASEAAFVRRAVHTMVEALAEEGVVSLFVRLHPLLLDQEPSLFGVGAVVRSGETVVLDLSEADDAQWRGIRSGHRGDIRRALSAGVVPTIDHEWTHFDDFVRLYAATMRRVKAHRDYHFDADYVRGLRRALGDRLHLGIARVGDAVVAAGLFTEIGGIVQYHLSGMDDAFASVTPTKVLLDFVRRWAGSRGNRWFHLGGGLGAQKDTLFHFKAGFSRHRLPFHTWRVITDPINYASLVRSHNPVRDPLNLEGYFPAYREPRPAGAASLDGQVASAMATALSLATAL